MKKQKNKAFKKYRKFLFENPGELYPYFPQGRENMYLPRDNFEDKILKKILSYKKGDGKIILIKSQYNNGNTSLLNYLMPKVYESDEFYSNEIISISGSLNERLTILKRIYPDVWVKSFSFLKEIYINLFYKLKFSQTFLLLLSVIAIYIFTSYLLSLATFKLPSILSNLINILLPGLTSIFISSLIKRNPEKIEEDDNLIERLKLRLPKKLKSDIHSWFMLLDNPWGFYIFIDNIENLDPESCIILSKILQDRNSLGMNCCVIVYRDEKSKVIKDIKEKITEDVIEETLRPFAPDEIKFLAKRHNMKISKQQSKTIKVAELMRGITPAEEEGLYRLCLRRRDSTKAFDDLTVMYYMFFIPFEQRKIPIDYVIKSFFSKFLSPYLISLIGDHYEENELKVTSSEPHWEDYSIEIEGKTQKLPILNKTEKYFYIPDVRFSELLKEKNSKFFEQASLGALEHVYLFWGLYNFLSKRPWSLVVANRFIECFKNCNTNISISKEKVEEIDKFILDGLFKGGEYLLDQGVNFYNSFSAFIQILRSAKNKSLNSAMTAKVIDKIMKIYFYTYDCRVFQQVEKSLQSQKIDTNALPYNTRAHFLFRELISGTPLNEIKPHIEKLDESSLCSLVKLLQLIKEQSLWLHNTDMVEIDILEVPTSNGNLEEFLLSFARADIFRNNDDHEAYFEEVDDMLVRLSYFNDIKKKTRFLKGLVKPYLEAKILHHVYDLLQISHNGLESDKVVSLKKDVEFLFKIKIVTPESLFLSVNNLYEKIERIAYYSDANYLLVDICLSYAKLLYSQYKINPKEREEDREKIEMLIKKGIGIEKSNRVCVLSPLLYLLWRKCLKDEAFSKNIYTRLFYTLEKFNYPVEVKIQFLKTLLESLNRHGKTDREHEQICDLCDKYLGYFKESEAEDLVKKLEEIDIRLRYKVQPLKNLGLLDVAKREIEEIERVLNALPESTKLIPLRISKDLIKFDLLTSLESEKESESRKEIMMNLYYKLMEGIQNFGIAEDEKKERIVYFLNELDEIISRAIEYIDVEKLKEIAERFYSYDQKKLDELSKWRFPKAYLKAAYRLSQVLIHNKELTISLLESLQYVAESEREIDMELKILELLKIVLSLGAVCYWKYQQRYQEIVKLRAHRILESEDVEQRFTELERIATAYPSEDTPSEIRDRFKESMALFYKGSKEDIISCFELLKDWYEKTFELRDDIFYDEIRMMELLMKCYRKINPYSSKEMSQLEKGIFISKRRKEMLEIERLIREEVDPDIVEVLKILKEKMMQGRRRFEG